jgi:uncharacterized glyoxalase superfamily metalloenzyme YdcJ
MTTTVPTAALRAGFALGLAQLYGTEVPAYNTLVEVSREVNADVVAARGPEAERLGDINRVTAERHGAIRVGSPRELAQAARVFAGFGMHPVGFYDLRDSGGSGVPVVSTAFRPIDADELAVNPFRVFTSMLVADDPRYFDAATRQRLVDVVGARTLFPDELLGLADRAADGGGLDRTDADRFLALATASFRLSPEPIDRAWHDHLAAISSVAADIGGTPSTHINHLTPRVLDIDELYRRMQDRGIEMIDAIQGPPRWSGPDVLLRQTSFRALAERRTFREADGSLTPGDLRVRFGEVEQRGIALAPGGVRIYERAIDSLSSDLAPEAAETVWATAFPSTEAELAARGLGWFRYRATGAVPPAGTTLTGLVTAGALTAEPIVYEDFLPRSAAGIFASNLTSRGDRDETIAGVHYDLDRLAGIIDRPIHDPQDLYRDERARSIAEAGARLGIRIEDDVVMAE